MVPVVVDSQGNPLRLGTKLGEGGEGSVFEVTSRNDVVAKIYHQAPDISKQNKIREMVQCGNAKLLNFATWPMQVLTEQKSGKVAGFLMPKVAGMTPLHEVYSPAHRRQDHPEWGWNFLVYVARNLAAAFHSVHEHGHVLGDVNQGNAFVSAKSKVVLIDCDSYQIDFLGHKHLCEVGVAHFTPPELQGIPSFKGVVRSPNHDCFGLALLIFHILFGGRHPFAGVPQTNGVGDSLEDSIKQLRFAYSPSANSRHLLPPPRSIPLSIVPPGIAKMFDIAFTEEGRNVRRPSAKEWVDAMDHLKDNLKVCSSHKGHHYYKDLHTCPWCSLETQGVIYFNVAVTAGGPISTFTGDMNKLWAAIQAVQLPASIFSPPAHVRTLTPAASPSGAIEKPLKWIGYAGVVFAFFAIAHEAPKLMMLWLIIGGFLLYQIANFGEEAVNAERQRRRQELSAAEAELKNIIEQMEREAGIAEARHIIVEVSKLKNRFDGLAAEEQRALVDLPKQAHQRQLNEFLDKYYVDQAKLSGIGPTKLATLRSFGIETAADIEWNRIIKIRGFGEVLTRTLVDWRKEKERIFKFNPARGVTDVDRCKVQQKYVSIRQDIERKMRDGLHKLQSVKSRVDNTKQRHHDRLQVAFNRKAQAEMDLRKV